ncbi:MAG: hypothetical protein JHC93_04770 [Parachlamydiales bacterium]|nr:hypothetical protein [Parachlamydiales bacterium]
MQFQLKSVKQNILLLLAMDEKCALRGVSDGSLTKTSSLFTFFYKKNVNKIIDLTFFGFLAPIQHPIDKSSLKKIFERKKDITQRVIEKLTKRKDINPSVLTEIKRQFKHYERVVTVQLRLINNMEKAVKGVAQDLWIQKTDLAMNNHRPFKPDNGCSGAYFLSDDLKGDEHFLDRHINKKSIMGVFKPYDEEIGAPNNPRHGSFQGELGARSNSLGIRVGENVHREVAAYYLDQKLGFNLVPKTQYAEFSNRHFYSKQEWIHQDSVKVKKGSYQEFKKGYCIADAPFYLEVKQLAPKRLQQLFLFDTLINNTDRHGANLLIDHEKIAAIDNGRSFGDRHSPPRMFYKDFFQQMQIPFDDDVQKAIQSMDLGIIQNKLKKRFNIEHKALQRLQERHALIKSAFKRGLKPFELAIVLQSGWFKSLSHSKGTLEDKAHKIISLALATTKNYLQTTKRSRHSQLIPSKRYLVSNKKLSGTFCRQLKNSACDGYIYGVGSGIIFYCLQAFEGDTLPKKMISVDQDPYQVLVALTLKYGMKTAANWEEFLELLGNTKKWKLQELIVFKQITDPLLKRALKKDGFKKRTPFFESAISQKKGESLISIWNLLRLNFKKLQQLALNDLWDIHWGHVLDPKHLTDLTNQPVFSNSRSIIYLSNMVDYTIKSLMESYQPFNDSETYFIHALNNTILWPLKNLLQISFIETSYQRDFWLHFHSSLPEFNVPDFFPVFARKN